MTIKTTNSFGDLTYLETIREKIIFHFSSDLVEKIHKLVYLLPFIREKLK